MLKAGADDYIVMRVDSIRSLPSILRRTIDRYSGATSPGNRPLRVLYAGDIQLALRKLGHLHHIKLSGARIDDDGSWIDNDGEQFEDFPYDAVVLDDTFSGTQVLQHLKDLRTRAPEIPALILIPPERDETAVYAFKMGAAQCVLKTGEYFERLLQAMEKTIRLRDLVRENETLLDSESRVRTLIETVPASIIVMACDGTVMAMNRAGLQALDIKSTDWLVGKRFTQLIDSQYRKEFSSFLERICSGGSDSIVCPCRTAKDTDQSFEFRAVPLNRDDDIVTILCSFYENPREENQPDLDSKLQDLAQQLKSSVEERSAIQGELKSAETDRAELLEAQRQDREKLETITRELEQARATIEEARLSAEEEKSRHDRQLEDERIQGEDNINELGERLKASEEEHLSLQEALKSAQEARVRLSEEAEHNQKQLGSISEELDRSQAALEELHLSAEKQRSQLVMQLEEESARGEAASLELRERLEDSEKQRSVLDESLESTSEAQEKLLEEQGEHQEDLEITRNQLAETREALEQERRDTAVKLDAERTEWSNKVQELERHLEETVETGNQLDESLREVQADREQLRREYTADRSRWEDEQRRIEQWYAELEETHSTVLKRTRQTEEDYESERANEAAKYAVLEDEKSVREDALRKAEMALIKLAEKYEKDIASRVATCSKMENDLQKADERRDELESKLRALQMHYVETVKEQQAELSTLKEKHLEQQGKLKRAVATLAEFQDSICEPGMDSSREKAPPSEQTVPGEELAVSGLKSQKDRQQPSDISITLDQTGIKESQFVDPQEEIRLLHTRVETLRSEVQEQLTARKGLSHALQALAVRHREMIAFRRRDRARLEALRAELEELRARAIRHPQSTNDTVYKIHAQSESET